MWKNARVYNACKQINGFSWQAAVIADLSETIRCEESKIKTFLTDFLFISNNFWYNAAL